MLNEIAYRRATTHFVLNEGPSNVAQAIAVRCVEVTRESTTAFIATTEGSHRYHTKQTCKCTNIVHLYSAADSCKGAAAPDIPTTEYGSLANDIEQSRGSVLEESAPWRTLGKCTGPGTRAGSRGFAVPSQSARVAIVLYGSTRPEDA